MNRPVPEPVRPGQESVWAYPRPPWVEPTAEHVEVWLDGVRVAASRRALRVLETSGWITSRVAGSFKGGSGTTRW